MNKKLLEKKHTWKKWFLGIGISILVLILAFPFSLDFYLQRKLPDVINDKTPYKIELQDFSLSLLKGNFTATDLKISTKNPKDFSVTQINGIIKKIEIHDFSIWKALFHKAYHADQLLLTDSKINMRLAPKKKGDKKQKKATDIHINNILINNVFADIKNADGKPVFAGENINIRLKDIKQSDNDSKIPIAFTEFKIDAKRVKIGVNEFYEVDADEISAANKTLELNKFHLKPLQNPKNYNAKNIFDFYSENLLAKDFSISQDSLIVSDIIFKNPDLKVTSTGKNTVQEEKNPKEIEMKIGLKNISFEKGKIVVLQADLDKTASIDQFNFKLSNIVFDKNTVKEKIPFRFTNHDIEADNIYFKANKLQAVRIKKVVSKDANILFEKVQVSALAKSATKDLFNIETDEIKIINNQTKYIGQKLNIEMEGIDIKSPDINIISSTHKQNSQHKKSNATVPDFAAKLGFIHISNGKIAQTSLGKRKLAVGKLDIKLQNLSSNTADFKNHKPVIIGKRTIDAQKIDLDAGKYYTLKIAQLKNSGNKTDIKELKYLPKYSRAGFSKVIAKETDLYTISVKNISITDRNSELFRNPLIDIDKVEIDGLNCNIYHDLAPVDDHDPRILFSKKLRNIKIPMFIKTISMTNSALVYEEDAENGNIPGKLTFDKFGILINNVNNGKIKGRPTVITANANFAFYESAKTNVVWTFDVMNMQDEFKIKGDIQKLSAENVNLFVRPYLNVTLDGNIDYLKFDYYGTNAGIAGKFYFKYNNMYVNLLNKKGKERKILSTVANWFVKNESKGEPTHVLIQKKRDPEKSFFNMLWQGIMEGLKKYVI
mgnify:FL=1